MPTGDGNEVNGLWFKANNSRGVILYFHGNAGSLAGWGYISQDILPLGYDLLITDYRSYGKSSGKLSPEGLFQDAESWYNFLLDHYDASEIVLYGRSLGTGIATYLASREKANALILETPFYSMSHLAAHHVPWLPHKLILQYDFSSYKYAKEVNCPVLILHGDRDNIVPLKSGEKLATVFNPSQVTFSVIQGGNHNNLSSFEAYHENLERFLKKLP